MINRSAIAASLTPVRIRAGMLAALGAGVVATAFAAGGYYVASWGLATLIMALLTIGLWGAGAVQRGTLGWLAAIAIGAFGVLAAATAVGAFTADNRSLAWLELGRTCGYLLVVVLAASLATGHIARRAGVLGVIGMTVAVAAVAIYRLFDDPGTQFLYGRLLGPVGYHNGLAMLLVIPLPTVVALVAARTSGAIARAALLAGGALVCCVAVLPLSRGSALFAVILFTAYFIIAPLRLRSVLALLPLVAVIVVGWHVLTGPFDAEVAERSVTGPARDAARYALAAAAAAGVYGALWAVLERWVRPGRTVRRVIGTILVVIALAVAVSGAVAGVQHLGGPAKAWHTAVKRFKTDEKSGDATRTSITNNGRLPLWEVAVDDAKSEPVFGIGGGNWEATYYRDRSRRVGYVRQPHNLSLELLAERGVVGLAAFLTFALVVVIAAWPKMRRGHDEHRALAAAILAGFLWWLFHAQLDWFWQLASVTMPALLFAGMLLGRTDIDLRTLATEPAGWPARCAVVATALAAVVVSVPLWMSARYLDRATKLAPRDSHAALQQLDRAHSWNHLDPEVDRLRARIEEHLGDPDAAAAAIERQRRLDPIMWSAWLRAARYYDRRGDHARAHRDVVRARELNPLEPGLATDKQALSAGITDDPFQDN